MAAKQGGIVVTSHFQNKELAARRAALAHRLAQLIRQQQAPKGSK